MTVAADEAPVALAPLLLQQQFSSCGFTVTNSGSPANPNLLDIRDPGPITPDSRLVRAIVYTDADAASAAHQRAHLLAENRAQVDVPMNDDNGPQVLPGYGGTVWRNNVALMESNEGTLNGLYTWDPMTDETTIANPQAFDLGFVRSPTGLAVDADVVRCAEQAFAPPPVTVEQPAAQE